MQTQIKAFKRLDFKRLRIKKSVWKKYFFLCVMLAFPIAHFIIFWVSINFNSVLMSFKMEMNGEYYYTLAHFKRLFTEFSIPNSNIWKNLKSTLLFFPAGTLIGMPLSLLFSYFLFKKIKLNGFFRVVFFLPSIISPVALAALFKYTIAVNGPMSNVQAFFGIKPPIDFLGSDKYAIYTVLFYSIWVSFGYNIVLFSAAMGRIPDSIFESLKLDGAGIFTEIFRFVIPLIWPTVSMLIILGVANIFTVIGPVLLLTGGDKGTTTISLFIYNQVKYSSENAYAYATAVGIFFMIVALPLVYIVKFGLEKVGKDVAY